MAHLALIRTLLKEKGLTTSEVCQMAEITPQSLGQMIQRNSTKTEILERIARVLGVPVGYFFDEQSNVEIIGSQIMSTEEKKEIEYLNSLLAVQSKLIEEKERRIQDKDAMIKMLSEEVESLKNKS